MEVINLNLIPNGTNPVVHVSQYDEGRDFRFNLFDVTSVLTLDGTETIECDVKKPDGNIVTVAVTNTSSNYVIVTTTLQMTACSGNSLGTINISKGGINLYTLNFVLYCERSPLENGIESESSIHDLQTQIGEAVAEQYDADSVVFDSVPTVGHGTGFAVTSEGVANAVQDAKDYTDTAIGGLTIPENITDLQDTDINNPTNGEILVYNNGSWENQANPSSTANFAPDYDDTATYNTNDKVIYQGLLYVCLEDSVTGAWDSTKWQNISVADYNAELLPIESGSTTNTKDYIDSVVESGSNANGNYIKYADGTMICTKTIEFSVATSEWQAWGTCYETALKDCGVWAMNFISSPVVSATQTGGAAWLEYFYDTDNTNVGKTRFVRPTVPGATAIYKMNVIGFGRWKA